MDAGPDAPCSPLAKLARVVVAVDDLSPATRDYGLLLGRSGSGDGLFALRNTTLQLVAREDTEVAGALPSAAGVAGLSFREEGRARGQWLPPAETRGIPIGLARDVDEEGEFEPSPLGPGVKAEASVAALDHVVISTGDLEAALALYGERLGLRLALDRSFEKRGLRILFFRVGGTTVEVVGALPGAARPEGGLGSFAPEADRFGGLAWEVEDVAAMRARLVAEGFDVSELRTGHKPGTVVCSVRSRTHGVPTLLKGPDRG